MKSFAHFTKKGTTCNGLVILMYSKASEVGSGSFGLVLPLLFEWFTGEGPLERFGQCFVSKPKLPLRRSME